MLCYRDRSWCADKKCTNFVCSRNTGSPRFTPEGMPVGYSSFSDCQDREARDVWHSVKEMPESEILIIETYAGVYRNTGWCTMRPDSNWDDWCEFVTNTRCIRWRYEEEGDK